MMFNFILKWKAQQNEKKQREHNILLEQVIRKSLKAQEYRYELNDHFVRIWNTEGATILNSNIYYDVNEVKTIRYMMPYGSDIYLMFNTSAFNQESIKKILKDKRKVSL